MGINLSDASLACHTVARTFEKDGQFIGQHYYLAINKDENGTIIGCKHTKDRIQRASLLEINEFANICFQQYSTENNLENREYLNKIKNCIEVIETNVNDSKNQNCLNGLWFWLQLGTFIMAATREIILRMSGITAILDVPEINQKDSIANEALLKAKELEEEGQNPQALKNYILASKNGNLEATNILIECYASGRLGQKRNAQEALKYRLKVAEIHLEAKDHDAFSNACRQAFELAGQQTLLYIIRHWHLDITTLFTIDEIRSNVASYKEILAAYTLNARAYMDKGNVEKAREQCNYINKLVPSQGDKLFVDLERFSQK